MHEKFIAGLLLRGTEIKSIREGKVNMVDAYCAFRDEELWVVKLNINEYSHGNIYNHDPVRERKLLLKKRELKKLGKAVREAGSSIVPLRLFVNEKGLAKLEIALAKGKKIYDKRESIKAREAKVQLDRVKKTGC